MAGATPQQLVERIEHGIESYRTRRRRRRNPRHAVDAGEPATVERSTEVLLPGTDHETTLYEIDAPAEGPTAFVLAGQHGIEPSGWKAAERLLEMTPRAGTLVVVPRADQTAIEAGQYLGIYDGVERNLNRQWPSNRQPTVEIARVIWDRFTAYDPEISFDLHSSQGIYKLGRDVDFEASDEWDEDDEAVGQAIFPTDDAEAVAADVTRTLSEEFVVGYDDPYDYRVGGEQDGSRPLFSHKVGADHDGDCLLCEPTKLGTSEAERIEWNLASVVLALEHYGITFEESI